MTAPGSSGSMPDRRRDRARGGEVVAGEQHRSQAELAQRRRPPSALVGFTASATTNTAVAAPSQPADDRGVAGRLRRRPGPGRARAGGSRPQSASSAARPATTRWPSTDALDAQAGSVRERLDARAAARRARRPPRRWRGRSGARWRPRARRRAGAPRPRRRPPPTVTSTSAIRPVVTVPVLSRTIVSTSCVASSTSGPRMSTPSCAPRPVPTSSAVGVARPSAQGQAMISTATAAVNASVAAWPVSEPAGERADRQHEHDRHEDRPRSRSASRCTSALPDCASSTSRAMRASAVSAPTRVARTTSRPPALMVAPVTASPGPTSTGTGSPVSIDASTAEVPSSTTPSVAICSPGRTTNRMPGRSSLDRRPALAAVVEERDVLGARATGARRARRPIGAWPWPRGSARRRGTSSRRRRPRGRARRRRRR